ncbi:MAG: GNAT family N-acetyltransferase [Christensenellales bacterium]|jgi:GNAT superfamily N-acetyltransferase
MRMTTPAQRAQIAPLFADFRDSLVASALSGMMGETWAQGEPASCAAVVLGDFCFLAGVASGEDAQRLLSELPILDGRHDFIAIGGDAWFALLKARFSPAARRITRWAFAHEDTFDRGRLAQMTALPEGYEAVPIAEHYAQIMAAPWSRDFCAQFADEADFRARGHGFAARFAGEIVAGASSYSVYPGGIEIEIDTRMDHRRKGLARALAARLILHCLERGLFPSWDAANEVSVRLAQSLGYCLLGPYPALGLQLCGD